MKVEILYVAGCPNLAPARELVAHALEQHGVRAEVQAVLVSGDAALGHGGFAGSPTILVNGSDVEPAPPAGMACRIYAGGKGVPPVEAILRAIERARAEEEKE
jgi:hypothetical protein